jgi:Uma2 family endonuclease
MVAPPSVYSDRLVTARELATMADAERYELVRGHLVPVSPTSTAHGRLGSNLTRLIMNHVYDNDLGACYIAETCFDLSREGDEGETVLGADLAFIRAGRVPPDDGDAAYARIAPDFVLEVASGSQSRRELADKAKLWLSRGARLCWVQWPRRRTIDVWHPGDTTPRTMGGAGAVLDGEDIVPGLRISLEAAFR